MLMQVLVQDMCPAHYVPHLLTPHQPADACLLPGSGGKHGWGPL